MVGDIAGIVAGLASYAVDSLIIPELRPRPYWRALDLASGELDRAEQLGPRADRPFLLFRRPGLRLF